MVIVFAAEYLTVRYTLKPSYTLSTRNMILDSYYWRSVMDGAPLMKYGRSMKQDSDIIDLVIVGAGPIGIESYNFV